ncbi:MAG: carbon-nitrogen hydrolase family protein [Kiritimatiellae bacterium]|nr:carbon-nitrogen hydrolase family protein [Kiritimatiellia bacterium]
MQPLRIAAIQNSAALDVQANLAAIEALMPAPGAADLTVLPEVFALRGDTHDLQSVAEPLGGPLCRWLAAQAIARRCWLLAGSIVERDGANCYNTSVLFDRNGRVSATYRKIHLFEARLEDGRHIRENDSYQAGHQPCLTEIEGWRCGLSICYDLRFPELFRHYAAHGAHLLLAPANFTQRTGRDHWDVLVRARAIENQCFVVAPDQCGADPRSGVLSHGHSLIVGPWGECLAVGDDAPRMLAATLDPETIAVTRARVPVERHRRL